MSRPEFHLIRVSEDANTEPVSLTAAKAHLRVSSNAHDTLIQTYLTAARRRCEAYTNRVLINGSFVLTFDGAFPCDAIVFPVGVANVANVSISYIDTEGESQTLEANTVTVAQRSDDFPLIVPNTSFPSTRYQPNAVTVAFDSGDQSVDFMLKAGILLFTSHLYHNRESVIVGTIAAELPQGVPFCWEPERLLWL
jgi:uncharacterized phiE125 gp8 family phage protein